MQDLLSSSLIFNSCPFCALNGNGTHLYFPRRTLAWRNGSFPSMAEKNFVLSLMAFLDLSTQLAKLVWFNLGNKKIKEVAKCNSAVLVQLASWGSSLLLLQCSGSHIFCLKVERNFLPAVFGCCPFISPFYP